MRYLTLLLLLLLSCGRDDEQREKCTAYGEECHPDVEAARREKHPEVIVGPQGPQGAPGKDGQGCVVEIVADGALVHCGTDSVLVPSGKSGKDGVEGTNGQNGTNGSDGVAGQNGTNGQDGYSVAFATLSTTVGCTNGGHTILMALDLNRNGAVDPLIDSNLQSIEMCNGADAPPSQFTPVAVVDPCGDAPGIYDEVFLRLYNGQLLWSLSDNQNGLNTRFSLAVPGNWMTTDGSHCYFTVDSNFNVINQHY